MKLTRACAEGIGLSLYENLGSGEPEESMGTEVVRLQWLDVRCSGEFCLHSPNLDCTNQLLKILFF